MKMVMLEACENTLSFDLKISYPGAYPVSDRYGFDVGLIQLTLETKFTCMRRISHFHQIIQNKHFNKT